MFEGLTPNHSVEALCVVCGQPANTAELLQIKAGRVCQQHFDEMVAMAAEARRRKPWYMTDLAIMAGSVAIVLLIILFMYA